MTPEQATQLIDLGKQIATALNYVLFALGALLGAYLADV